MQSRAHLLTNILDGIADGVIAADEQGDYLYVNSSVRQILDIDDIPDVEMARRPAELGFYRPDEETLMPLEELPMPRALTGERTDDIHIFIRNDQLPDGMHLSVAGRPITLDDGSNGAVVVFRDITHAKKAATLLEDTTRQFSDQTMLLNTILDTLSEGVVVTGEDGRLVYANNTAEHMIGKPALDVPPSEWVETYGVFLPDQRTPADLDSLPLVQALHGNVVADREFFIRNDHRPDGVSVNVWARPLEGAENGEIVGAVGVLRDISKRKAKERELRATLDQTLEQEVWLRTVLESTSEGVVVVDGQGEFKLFNAAAEEIVGEGMLNVPPEEWNERYGLFEPEEKTLLPVESVPLVRALAGKQTVEMEIFVRNQKRPDGVYILVNADTLPDLGGGIAVFRDITEHRKSVRERERTLVELYEQTELMETVFDTLAEGIVAVDREGAVIHINRAARAITKIADSGLPFIRRQEEFKIYHPDRATPVDVADLPVIRAANKGDVVEDEDVVLVTESRPEGVVLRISAKPLLEPDGSRRGGVAIFRDITERARAEDALAEAFAQGKIEIIDTVLHNIGNAVNSVATGIDTIDQQLQDDTLTQRFQALVDALETHREDWPGYIANDPQGQLALPFVIELGKDLVDRDLRMRKTVKRTKGRSEHIADIIRTQRVFRSQAVLLKEVNLLSSLNAVLGLLERSIEALGIKVEIELEQAPKVINIQESGFQQMMVNLVKNSIDSLNDRSAAAESDWAPRIWIRGDIRYPYLVIEVEDNGIGIPADKLKAIFDAGFTTKRDGTGLGLHSASVFVRRSGGHIRATSAGIGRGSTIRLEMRLSSLGLEESPKSTDGSDIPLPSETQRAETGPVPRRSKP